MARLESQTMENGTAMPSFLLKDANGNDFHSDSVAKNKLVLIIFNCNHCPYAIASWPILNDLYLTYKSEGLEIIAINPNNNPDYPDDRFETMAPYAKKNGITFPYLFDTNQAVAKLYQAVCTPDPYLFLDGNLFYHGRLNDNWQEPALIKEHSMDSFIKAALGKGDSPSKRFPSIGCSIKWVT